MDKKQKKLIKELQKKEKYNDIYQLFGTKAFLKYTPNKYKKEELIDLICDGRFLDIYNKYGENMYKRFLPILKEFDIKNEVDNKNMIVWERAKSKLKGIKHNLSMALCAINISLMSIGSLNAYEEDQIIKENIEKLEEYNDGIEEYAQNVRSMNLSDIEIIMKVIYDTWHQVDEYGVPEDEIPRLYRLSLMGENQVGVCRHLADDTTAKLNKINPEYNARNMFVYLDPQTQLDDEESNSTEEAKYNQEENILYKAEAIYNQKENENENKYVSTYESFYKNILNGIESNYNSEVEDSLHLKIFGNHMVTAIDIDGEIIIVDTTNVAIGHMVNGEIIMSWSKSGEGMKYTYVGELLHEDIIGMCNIPANILKSYLTPSLLKEEFNEKYGREAQIKALQKIRQLEEEEKENKSQEENKVSKEKNFRESQFLEDFYYASASVDKKENKKTSNEIER